MTLNIPFIQKLFPDKKIYGRLADLFIDHSLMDTPNDCIYLSVELNQHSRKFFSVSINELCLLFERSHHLQRPLYEVIRSTKKIKPYIDFEYNIATNSNLPDHSIGLRSALKILHNLFHSHSIDSIPQQNSTTNLFERFLVLDA